MPCTCAPFYWAIDRAGPARSTPFLCSCAKKRGGAPKKRAYRCRHGSCSVPPASPTDSKPQHHRRLRQADFAWPINQPASSQLDAPICPVGAYAQMGEAGGPTRVMWRLQRRFSLAARHRFFWQDKRNGVERQDRPSTPAQRNDAHVQGEEKGGTPGEGSPLDPLMRLCEQKRGGPRSVERGQGLRPCTLQPLKRWTKLSDTREARSEVLHYGGKKCGIICVGFRIQARI